MRLRLDATIWGEINASLKPVVDSFDKDSSCLLLCSGKSDFCRIAPVSLGNDKGSVDHWRSTQKKAWSLRGRWRWPRWAGKPRLELVEIRVLALHPSHPGDLSGLCEVVDLETRIRELRDQVSDFDAIASKRDYDEYGDDYIDIGRCWYDEDKRQCVHGEGCNGFWGDENADYHEYFGCSYPRYCGMEELRGRLEEISKLEAAALWSATLENPILAAGNSLFPAGLVKSSKAFYEDLHRASASYGLKKSQGSSSL
ncbi:hypothetical protein CGCF413_v005620 [Colletotrichum fructicola]|nr:hypothetical protein CGCF413_v005620 [Colletotrichum fructicola]